jgi:hypothetical protein
MLQDGQEFARGSPPGFNPYEMNPKFQLTCDIAFVKPQVVHSEPVLEFLANTTQLVEAVVNVFVQYL